MDRPQKISEDDRVNLSLLIDVLGNQRNAVTTRIGPLGNSNLRPDVRQIDATLAAPMKVGQKVVCVDDAAPPHLRLFYSTWIKKGTVYVVRGVFLGVDYQSANPGEVGVYLLGIHNPLSNVPPFPERGFNAQRFRPIEEHPVHVTKKEEAEIESTT